MSGITLTGSLCITLCSCTRVAAKVIKVKMVITTMTTLYLFQYNMKQLAASEVMNEIFKCIKKSGIKKNIVCNY